MLNKRATMKRNLFVYTNSVFLVANIVAFIFLLGYRMENLSESPTIIDEKSSVLSKSKTDAGHKYSFHDSTVIPQSKTREKVDSALVVFGNVTEGEVQADSTDSNPQGVFCVPEKVALAREKMEGFELVRSYNSVSRYAELLMMKIDTNNDGLILSNELPLESPLLRYAGYPETPISEDDSEASPRNDIALTIFDVENILIEYFEVADEDNDQVLNTFEFEKMKNYMYSKESTLIDFFERIL